MRTEERNIIVTSLFKRCYKKFRARKSKGFFLRQRGIETSEKEKLEPTVRDRDSYYRAAKTNDCSFSCAISDWKHYLIHYLAQEIYPM